MSKIKILGVDPALTNVGLALTEVDLDEGTITVTRIDLIETSASKTKVVRKNSEDLERARHIWSTLLPYVNQADVLAVELPVGSQTARAMCSYGICIGLFATIKKPLIQLTATEVKAVSGNKNASKADMIAYAVKEFPNLPWLKKKSKGVVSLVSKNEHIADAICAALASLNTDEFKMIELSFSNITNKGNTQ
jgi:Holliday junction resolvasome RuvABC endonuclease subunit